jgi:hypothetical protein
MTVAAIRQKLYEYISTAEDDKIRAIYTLIAPRNDDNVEWWQDEEIGISYGKKKEVIAKIVPKTADNKPRRKLGILQGKGKATFHTDFKITEQDFLNL